MSKAEVTSLSAEEKAHVAAAAASEGKAEEIVILDLRELSGVTDYFVIFTGTSQIHLKALGDRIEKALSERQVKPTNVDGSRGTGWMVFDYGNVIIHAMTAESRALFDLERLWGDAPVVAVS